ncbi:hypothetical protein OUZ56_011539 [Daphnia magna]|uniref:GMP synthase n=1 Tax=Daphnia magna TaxID=35525 RepID=A0ABQ9Z0M8_9CRUS|nr:hypothetical protein OUZ56_011539 [Daphnia magna]
MVKEARDDQQIRIISWVNGPSTNFKSRCSGSIARNVYVPNLVVRLVHIVSVIETMDSIVMSGDLLSEISRNPIRDVLQSCT